MKKVLSFLLVIVFTMSMLFVGVKTNANAAASSTRDEEGNYVGRAYDEDFDLLYDNCDTEDGYLRATFNNALGITEDDPIFKSCSNYNEQGTYNYLVFKMRSVEGASLVDLKLSFRKADGIPFITVPFAELLDPDLDSFKDLGKELSDEYQLYVINLNDSLDGQFYDEASTIPGDNKFLGFHLISAASTDELKTIEIDEIYFSNDPLTTGYVNNGQNALMDAFQRTNVAVAPDGIYWCGSSCGEIIYGVKTVSADQNYELNLTEANACDYLVVTLRGQSDDAHVFVKFDSGEALDLHTLKDTDSTSLPTLTKTFNNYVINLEANGIEKGFSKVTFTTEGVVYIDRVFGSNLEVSDGEPVYPTLDKDILMYDDFNRETLGAYGEWMAENEVATTNGFDYLISYSGLDKLSIQNGALVFDNTENPIDYFNYKSNASTRINNGSYPYLVFKVKVTDGGSLDNLRFQTLEDDAPKGGIIWANALYSAKNLKIAAPLQEEYPYVTEDGWTYVIVDLALNGMSTKPSGLDLYWGGNGKLYIGSIFYAKNRQIVLNEETMITMDDFERETLVASENEWWLDSNATIVEGDLVLTATGAGYSYIRTAAKQFFQNKDAKFPYLVLEMSAEDGATLKTLRMETISTDQAHIWVKDGGYILADGSVLDVNALTEEKQVFVIDLVASGFPVDIEGIGFGYDGEGESGKLHIASIKFSEAIPYDYTIEETMITMDDFERETLVASENEWWLDSNATIVEGDLVLTATGAGYSYIRTAAKQFFQNKDAKFPYLVLEMSAEDGATLKTLRMETISTDQAHIWVKDGGYILADGSVLDVNALTEEKQVFVIDLVASGFPVDIEGIGFGYDGEGESGKLHIASIKFSDAHTALMDVQAADIEKEVVTLQVPTLTLNGNSLDFNTVKDATGYELYLKDEKIKSFKPQDTLSYDLSNNELGSYAYSVKALGNGVTILSSEVSENKEYVVSVVSIAIKNSGKTEFEYQDQFDYSLLVIEGTTSNGKKVVVNIDDLEVDVSEFKTGVAGTYPIKVILKGTNVSVSYNVIVNANNENTNNNGCMQSASQLIISLISISSLFVFILRKKH